jgi:hypothetical protein
MKTLMRVFDRREETGRKWGLIERAAIDDSIAIKAGAIEELVYMLHDDRPRALSLFDRLMEGQPALLRSYFTDDFLYYGFFKDYVRIKPYILAMMKDDHEAIQQRGAELACIAAISPKAMESQKAATEAQDAAQTALFGPPSWRRGAAHIYALNAGRGAENCGNV